MKCMGIDKTQAKAVHKMVRQDMMKFTYQRLISEKRVAEMMVATGFNVATDLERCSALLTEAGHTIHSRGSVKLPPPATTTAGISDHAIDKCITDLPRRSMRHSQNILSTVSPTAAADETLNEYCQQRRVTRRRIPATCTVTKPSSDDEENSPSKITTQHPVSLSPARQKLSRRGVRYSYTHDKIKKALLSQGLYQELPETDPLLQGFQKYLAMTLGKGNTQQVSNSVTRVSRYMYTTQLLCNPTSVPQNLDIKTFDNRENCTSYFANLRTCRMSAIGIKSYQNSVKDFLNYLITCRNISDETSSKLQRFRLSLEASLKGTNAFARTEEASKQMEQLINPDIQLPPLHVIQQAYSDPDIIADVKAAANRCKTNTATTKDKRLLMRYLVGPVFQLGHFQRPGVPANMTLNEFNHIQPQGTMFVLAIEKHKTGTKYPACLALSKKEFELMKVYRQHVRGDCPEDKHEMKEIRQRSAFFRCVDEGTKIVNMSNELNRFQTIDYNIVKCCTHAGKLSYTADDVRHAVEQASHNLFAGQDEKLKKVSDYLTHSRDVAKKYYTKRQYSEVVDARTLSLQAFKAGRQ